jgi:hypothetical protein
VNSIPAEAGGKKMKRPPSRWAFYLLALIFKRLFSARMMKKLGVLVFFIYFSGGLVIN